MKAEDGRGLDNVLEVVEGLRFDGGYLSPYFVNQPEKQSVMLDDPCCSCTTATNRPCSDLLAVLEQVSRQGSPLLLIAEDVDGEALATLVVNPLRGVLRTCAVKAPGFGDRRAPCWATSPC